MNTDTFSMLKDIAPSVIDTGLNIKGVVDDVKDISKADKAIVKTSSNMKDKREVLELFNKAMKAPVKSGDGQSPAYGDGFVIVKK
jgi:hypothetical protein